jgi:Rad3-related DNA helicase
VCDEFHCLPDAARRALENDVNGSIFQIIDMRALANAKLRIDGAPKGEVPTDTTAQRYLRIHMESVGQALGIDTT